MADTLNAPSSMDVSLKENGVIVDMTPAALLVQQHSTSHHNLRSHKDTHTPERQLPADAVTTAATAGTTVPTVPTNLSTSSPSNTFRCERCDNFETNSRASLLLHVVQCLSSPVRLKAEAPDPENLSVNTRSNSSNKQNNNNNNTNNNNNNSNSNSNNKNSESSGTVIGTGAGSGSSVSIGLGKTPTEAANLSTGNMSNGNANTASSPAASSASSTASSTSRKVFECDVCNMKFSNGANMRRHKMRHTGVKPYECRVCQKRFFRKDHLAEHFTTHTKTLPYHCPICNRGFQRQIAMRAHFQNEHVGQHDLVKTCPLCSYRAGSMKSLRIHFFNRHGIDLDNPGPGGTSTLLLALESQASQVAAAAAAAGFVPGLTAAVTAAAAASAAAANSAAAAASASAAALPSHQSDSGESMRSIENATPPMHFLTPHVEISTLPDGNGAELFNVKQKSDSIDDVTLSLLRAFALQGHHNNNHHQQQQQPQNHPLSSGVSSGDMHNETTAGAKALRLSNNDRENGTAMDTTSPLPLDCNTKTLVPSSTSASTSVIAANTTAHLSTTSKSHHHHHHHDNHITPSISLIPIKQEPIGEDLTTDASKKNGASNEHLNGGGSTGSENSESEFSSSNCRLTSLIKVSPLKSLLREDLKRRICAKANNRITRNAAMLENNNVIQNTGNGTSNNNNNNNNNNNGSNCNSTPICNGTITSTGQDAEASSLNRKQILTCLFCGIEFPDETLYFLHKGCHCDSNPWKCNICGEQCNNVYEFNAHLLSKSHQ